MNKFIIALASAMLLFPSLVRAADELPSTTDMYGNTWYYKLKDGEAIVVSCAVDWKSFVDHNYEVAVPASCGACSVVAVGDPDYRYSDGYSPYGHRPNPLFGGNTSLRAVIIPNTVREIGPFAFEQCTGLVYVGKDLQSRDHCVFPSKLKKLGTGAFYECSSLRVASEMFQNLEVIGVDAFYRCKKGIENLELGPTITELYSLPPVTNSLTIEGNGKTVLGCTGAASWCASSKIVTIRNAKSVLFSSSTMEELVIENVDTVGGGGDELKTLTISGVKHYICYWRDFPKLERVNAASLSDWCSINFEGCPLLSQDGEPALFLNGVKLQGELVLPDDLKSVGSYQFGGCAGLVSVVIPEGVTNIGENAFGECRDLASVKLPDSLVAIGRNAFYGCENLTAVSLPPGLKSFPSAFCRCTTLKSVTFPEGLEIVDENAFSCCEALKAAILPAGLKVIGKNAFSECTNLSSVSFPESLECIYGQAFAECVSLPSNVDIPVNAFLCGYAFKNCTSLREVGCPVQQPSGIEDEYWLRSPFDGCSIGLTVVGNPESVPAFSFKHWSGVRSVILPDSVNALEEHAFYGCNTLEMLTLSANITNIGELAFGYCSRLEELTIPKSVTAIAKDAFEGCRELRVVHVDSSNAEIVRTALARSGLDMSTLTIDVTGADPVGPQPVDPQPVDPMVVDVPVVEPAGAFEAAKARTDNGVLVNDGAAFGVLQLKVGKASKKGESKVSVTVIGLDGKKYTSKAVKVTVGGTPEVPFEVKKLGTLTLTFGANGFSGDLNGMTATSVAGTAATTDGMAAFVEKDLSSLAGVLSDYLPADELVTRTAKKWKVVAKAGKLKYNKKANPKRGIVEGLQATGDNIAGLKLTYTPKTQTFKGSFRVWTFDETKKRLKSVTAKVTGVVIDGNGYGQAVVKKNVIGELTVK